MKNLIRAFSTAQVAKGEALPDSIEWMPAGTHSICCSRDGEPAEVTITVDESLAAELNAALQSARSLAESGKASRPYIDFDHCAEKAAAIPTEFFWQDGIRLRVEWTAAGAEAVAGRVYSYFSPEFFADKSGKVTGIPQVGPIGALVNTPAFQEIERIAASLTAKQSMESIAKALGLSETATEADILAKIAELSGTATECQTTKASLVEANAKIEELRKASATDEVARHAATAEIPEAIRPMIVDAILKDATEGRKLLASFKPAAKPAPGAAPLKGAQHGKDTSDSAILAEFSAMPEGKDKTEFQRVNAKALLRASRESQK